MKGDFSRVTFDPANSFSRVLMQQGRVSIDADSVEQTDILLHYLRTLATDIIGPYGAPSGGAGGFQISADKEGGLSISAGRYYVDGILVENAQPCLYTTQPYYPLMANDPIKVLLEDGESDEGYWVYLDVWERLITSIEDDSIREKALGGPDTSARTKVIWQVKAVSLDEILGAGGLAAAKKTAAKATKAGAKKTAAEKTDDEKTAAEKAAAEKERRAALDTCAGLREFLNKQYQSALVARVDPGEIISDPCNIAPDAQYRGAENQLYRVEIHRGGPEDIATFKWSRDNGSIATAWLSSEGDMLRVANARGFAAGNWIELSDDTLDLQGKPGILVKLAAVDNDALIVDMDSIAEGNAQQLNWSSELRNPKVRRWDQIASEDIVLADGAVPVVMGKAAGKSKKDMWLDLEDGIQISFAPKGNYRSGDYWLIPARVATGNIEWPVNEEKQQPALLPPRGVRHHYAPLALMVAKDGRLDVKTSCRCEFTAIRACEGEK